MPWVALGACVAMLTQEVLEAPLTLSGALFPWPGCQEQLGHSIRGHHCCWTFLCPCSVPELLQSPAGFGGPAVLVPPLPAPSWGLCPLLQGSGVLRGWLLPGVPGCWWPSLPGSHRAVSWGGPCHVGCPGSRVGAGWEQGGSPWGAATARGGSAACAPAPPHAPQAAAQAWLCSPLAQAQDGAVWTRHMRGALPHRPKAPRDPTPPGTWG